jgi:hypothetical protein
MSDLAELYVNGVRLDGFIDAHTGATMYELVERVLGVRIKTGEEGGVTTQTQDPAAHPAKVFSLPEGF